MHPGTIVVDKLTKIYGGVPVVDHISFEVQSSSIFGLLGPNGAGKTTTMKMMTGLARPTSGNIRILGIDFSKRPSAAKRRIGHVYASMAFYPYLTGAENLRFFGRFYGYHRRALRLRVDQTLEFVGLSAARNQSVGTYSNGMKQRLGIAKAMLHEPDVLLFDEATNGVDVEGTDDIRELMFELRVQGKTTVVTSHRLDEIELLCDRIAILDRGRIIGAGAPDEIRHQLDGLLFKYVIHAPNPVSLGEMLSTTRVRYTGKTSIVLSASDISARLFERFPNEQIEEVAPTFEEACLWILRHPDAMAVRSRQWSRDTPTRPRATD
jgi:ABC-2 type transport system ATP-binding protein